MVNARNYPGLEGEIPSGFTREIIQTTPERVGPRSKINPKRIVRRIGFRVYGIMRGVLLERLAFDDVSPGPRYIALPAPDWIGSPKSPRSLPAIQNRHSPVFHP